ncbi:MAG TPA: hypothetical protein PK156_05375, partial [Polyangium sp.]|nr:hypothetical protein [Polyangium sp.]
RRGWGIFHGTLRPIKTCTIEPKRKHTSVNPPEQRRPMTAFSDNHFDLRDILRRPVSEIGSDEARSYLEALEREDARNREVLIAALTTTTAVIHIVLGGKLFVLNGAGFLALLAARHLLPKNEAYQSFARESLAGYTGLTIIAYFLEHGTTSFADVTGIGCKLIELGLLRVLWADHRAARAKLERIVKAAESGESAK